VGDDGAKDTGEVAGAESHSGLRGCGVVGFLTRQALVHHFDDRLEGGKFHHRVRDLAAPEGVDSFVEAGWVVSDGAPQTSRSTLSQISANSPRYTFGFDDLADSIHGSSGEGRHGSLHAHLDGFKRAETDISKELGRRGPCEVDPSLVRDGCFGAGQIGVELLEELVAAVLEGSLDAVAEEGRRTASVDAAEAVGFDDLAPAVHVARVELAVDLAAAFDKVEGCHGPVGEAAGHQAAECARLGEQWVSLIV